MRNDCVYIYRKLYNFNERKYYNTRNCGCDSTPTEVPSLTAFLRQRSALSAVYEGSSLGFET